MGTKRSESLSMSIITQNMTNAMGFAHVISVNGGIRWNLSLEQIPFQLYNGDANFSRRFAAAREAHKKRLAPARRAGRFIEICPPRSGGAEYIDRW
jgi:hypothetical protein